MYLIESYVAAEKKCNLGPLRVKMWKTIEPFLVLRSLDEIWQTEPTFLLADVLLMSLLLSAIVLSVFCWPTKYAFGALVASFFGGAFIELLTILNTELGNFYHSQSSVQLFGGHEPVYMLFGCYIWLLWCPITLAANFAERFGASAFSEASIGALLASFTWGVLDTVGLGYLWWTWHTNDPLYAERAVSGVPVASSFWIMSSGFAAVYLMRKLRERGTFDCSASWMTVAAISAIAGPVASLGLMHVPFLALYHPIVTFGGMPAALAFDILRGICALALVVELVRSRRHIRFGMCAETVAVVAQVCVYAGTMAAIVLSFDPSDVRRTSYGQPLGTEDQCAKRIQESCFWGGFQRERYLCASNVVPARDQFDLRCTSTPTSESLDYYTLCGVAKSSQWQLYTFFQIGMCLLLCIATASIQKREKNKIN